MSNQNNTPVGFAAPLAGSNGGFTIAVFRAVDVPEGTPLYMHSQPAAPQVADESLFSDALSEAFVRYPHAHDALTFFACAISGPVPPNSQDIAWAKGELTTLDTQTASEP